MPKRAQRHSSYLFWGDLACFILALYLSLYLRSLELPDLNLLSLHARAFPIIFVIWLLVFYIAGLYEFRVAVFQQKLISRIINAQLINSGLTILIFYFVPYFGITPKTVLFIDLVITLILVIGWRLLYLKKVSRSKREGVVILGEGEAVDELKKVFAGNPHFGVKVVDKLEPGVSVVILDLSSERLPENLYPLFFTGVRFWDLESVYEDVFGRVSLPLLSERWFLENISLQPKPVYTFLKRLMDIVISLTLFALSITSYPFVWLANSFESGGKLFSFQTRIGQNNKPIRIVKLRTMTNPDDKGKWGKEDQNHTTKVGKFLRRSRVDEFPQLWNVIKGDLSLIGPRMEFPDAVREYGQRIPYYKVRHIIAPGISGWAQVNQIENPHHGVDVELTRRKLAYDLFYVKNRSFWLDFKIVLRTIRILLSRVGA